jgi:t-SNARE complex subunit (syntaxin)
MYNKIQQEQENKINEQDEMLDVLNDEVKKIKFISITIGDEMDEQNVLLDDMNDNVDNTNHRLNNANKKIDKIMEIAKNKYTCIIVFLIIILIIMIIIYFTH